MTVDPDRRIARARELRETRSSPEAVFWNLVRNRRLGGLKFRRQHPLGPFTVDFFCAEGAMVVELDGSTHNRTVEEDRRRDRWLECEGFLVVRIAVSRFMKNPEGVAAAIGRMAHQRATEFSQE